MAGFSITEWISLMEMSEFANATSTGSATSILGSDIAEDNMIIPLAFIISETSGAANSFSLSKSGEDTTTIHSNFNLSGDETIVITAEELATLVPRLEGGVNLDINAENNGVEITMIYVFPNEI